MNVSERMEKENEEAVEKVQAEAFSGISVL